MVKKSIKIVAAILIFLVLIFVAQEILVGNKDIRDQQRIEGFYEQKEDSLDAVFIGSSATYAFWMAPYAWMEYGITVYPYSTSSQPIQMAKYIMEETRKTQPNSMFIVNLASVQIEITNTNLHNLSDNMPSSLTKYQMIRDLTDQAGLNFSESLEFYLPFVLYHERWSELGSNDFNPPEDLYKTGNTYETFLDSVEDVSDRLDGSEYYHPLDDSSYDALMELVDYCEQENITVLFVVTPLSLTDETQLGMQNAAVELVRSRGFDVLDMDDLSEEIGIDYKTDYYNGSHMNMHGSIKVTSYLSQYLIQNYGLQDKRGDSAYADWDIASDRYYQEYLAPRLTEADQEYFTVR